METVLSGPDAEGLFTTSIFQNWTLLGPAFRPNITRLAVRPSIVILALVRLLIAIRGVGFQSFFDSHQ
jgi:hypothetical protein